MKEQGAQIHFMIVIRNRPVKIWVLQIEEMKIVFPVHNLQRFGYFAIKSNVGLDAGAQRKTNTNAKNNKRNDKHIPDLFNTYSELNVKVQPFLFYQGLIGKEKGEHQHQKNIDRINS